MRYGVKSITLDDTARALAISKKTIYQYFQNKADLVYEVARVFIQMERDRGDQMAHAARHAVEELVMVANWSFQTFRQMSPSLIFEVRKYYPQAWDLFEDFKSSYLSSKISENLRRGIYEGLFRSDLHIEIVTRMRLNQIDASLRDDLYPATRFDAAEVQRQLFDMYIRGLLTDRGREVLHQLYSTATPT